jgi:hypothetical protein
MTTNCRSCVRDQSHCAPEVFNVKERDGRASSSASRNWISFRRNWRHTRRRSSAPGCGRTDDLGDAQHYIDQSSVVFHREPALGQDIGHRYTLWRLYRWLRVLHGDHIPIALVDEFDRQVGANRWFHRQHDFADHIHVTDIGISLVENGHFIVVRARLGADVERIRALLQRSDAGRRQAPLGHTPRPPRPPRAPVARQALP